MMGVLTAIRDRLSWAGESKAANLAREAQALIAAITPKFQLRDFDSQDRDYLKYVQQYNGWVYACASKNASSVAQIPMRLYSAPTAARQMRDKVAWRAIDRRHKQYLMTKSHLGPLLNNAADVVEIIDHPFLNLIREVNPQYNGFELVELMELSLELTGNAYWYVVLQNGVPSEIWPLQSQWVTIKRDLLKGIKAYAYGKEEADIQQLEPELVAHFRFPNPKDYFYGLGPLEAAQLPVTLNNKFDIFENSILDNNAVMPFVFSTPQNLNQAAIERLREDVNKVHRGFKKAGKFGLFTGGLEPKSMAANPKDINYTDGHRITKEKIAAIFGVPLSLLTTEDVNKSNAVEGNVAYMRHTINPRLKRIEQTINQDIMPFYDDRIFVAFDNPVPEDKEFMLTEADTRLNNYSMTINEYRERMGEDEVEWGGEPLVTGQVHPLSETPEPMAPPVVEEPEVEEPEDAEERHVHSHEYKIANPIVHAAVEADMKRWLRVQSTAIIKATDDIVLTDANVIDVFVPWSDIKRDGVDTVGAGLHRQFNDGAVEGAKRLRRSGIESEWNVRNEQAINYASQFAAERVTLITDETRQALKKLVADSIRDGETTDILKKRILHMGVGLNQRQINAQATLRKKLEGSPVNVIEGHITTLRNKQINYRAEMIARTEMSKAWAQGNMASYRESGLEEKEFSAFDDACPICGPIDGKIFKMQDHSVDIPVHPNCRCDWLPVINF